MTRFDKLKTMDIKDVATELCLYISERVEDCEHCPFTDRCRQGHDGVLDYLMEGVKDDIQGN